MEPPWTCETSRMSSQSENGRLGGPAPPMTTLDLKQQHNSCASFGASDPVGDVTWIRAVNCWIDLYEIKAALRAAQPAGGADAPSSAKRWMVGMLTRPSALEGPQGNVKLRDGAWPHRVGRSQRTNGLISGSVPAPGPHHRVQRELSSEHPARRV